MEETLKVLIIEDSDDDFELLLHELRRSRIDPDWTRVQTEDGFRRALDNHKWDVIIADYALPSFGAEVALKILQEIGLDIPFIVVSGTIGEDVAVQTMVAGANDYVMKNVLTRLPMAIERELRDAKERQARNIAETALRKSEERFRLLAENAQDIIYRIDFMPDEVITYVSPAVKAIMGYETSEIYSQQKLINFLIHPDDRELLDKLVSPEALKNEPPITMRCRHKNGNYIWMEIRNTAILDDNENLLALEGIARDITERKEAELEIKSHSARVEALARIASRLNAHLSLQSVLDEICQETAKILDVQSVSVVLNHDDQNAKACYGNSKGICEKCMPVASALFENPLDDREIKVVSRAFLSDLVSEEVVLPEELNSMAFVPIIRGEELLGILTICSYEAGQEFSDHDLKLLKGITDQASQAISNTQLYEETRKRAAQLALLYDAGLALNSMLEPIQQLELLFQMAMGAINAEQVAFFRYITQTDELELELSNGLSEDFKIALQNIKPSAWDERKPVGWVAANRVPLNLPDISADTRFLTYDFHPKAMLLVPVIHAKQVQGVLGVFSEKTNAFSASDEKLLSLFANQAAVALENTRLFNDAVRHLNQLETLRAIDQTISGSMNLHVILNFVLSQIVDFLSVDIADILLLDQATQTLKFAAGRGFRTDALKRTRLRFGEGYAGKAAMERRIIRVPHLDLEHDGDELNRSILLPEENPACYYAVPLVSKGVVRGVIEILHRSPLDPNKEWFAFLEAVATQMAIAIDNATLFEDLQRSNMDLVQAYDSAIEGWAKILETRDEETEGHTLRVTDLTINIARRMGIPEADLVHIHRGALLHDIGKIGIPDNILLKPGPLTDEEWKIMRTHPEIAFRVLSPLSYLRPALDIPHDHHERWDGSGYPRGLKGEQIPLAARIFAVVDVWDALTSDRPYRKAWTEEKALAYIREQSGKHFDPQVVETFLESGFLQDWS